MSILQTVKRFLGIKTQIPLPEDDGFRPSTYSEGYGTTGESHEAGGRYYGIREVSGTFEGKLEPGSEHLLALPEVPQPRCESRKREGNRTWRCTKDAGHEGLPWRVWVDQWHSNGKAGRRW